MKYYHLQSSRDEDPSGFESARFHVINYILRQGEDKFKVHCKDNRVRPECTNEEFGTVISNEMIYSYHIEPLIKDQDRTLSIIIASQDSTNLEKECSKLVRGTNLRNLK